MSRPNVIKAYAANAGKSIRQVALATGVSPNTLYDVARGTKRGWPSLRQRLAAYFDVDEAVLFRDDETVAP